MCSRRNTRRRTRRIEGIKAKNPSQGIGKDVKSPYKSNLIRQPPRDATKMCHHNPNKQCFYTVTQRLRQCSKQKRCTVFHHFHINESVDFVFLPLGSLYASNMEDVISHFQCVSQVLRSGGLYLLDWVVQFDGFSESSESWESTHEELHLEGTYNRSIFDAEKRIYNEKITFKVTDGNKIYHLENEARRQALEPKDLNIVLEQVECFVFLGCWNNWNLHDSITWPQGLQGRIVRPIILLQRI